MNVISTLPKWASAPMQKLAAKEEIAGMQEGQMDQDTFNQVAQTAVGIISMTDLDEVPGKDLAMGQPGVVSPQEGVTLRFEGNPHAADSQVEAVLDASEQGAAIFVRSGPSGFDTVIVQKQGDAVVGQAAYVEQSPLGLSGYIVAGQVG